MPVFMKGQKKRNKQKTPRSRALSGRRTVERVSVRK